MEFLSDTEGDEYSSKPTYPPGKWFFYERVLQVPNYVIFEPDAGGLEVYQLDDSGQYQLRNPDANNRYWIAQMSLFLDSWQGSRENRTGYRLRWWDEDVPQTITTGMAQYRSVFCRDEGFGRELSRIAFAQDQQTVGQKLYTLSREALGQLLQLVQGLFGQGQCCEQVLEVLMPA